jgi:hypothetical protein
MCVFICANPTVHLWLNAITAHAEREVLQIALASGSDLELDDRPTLPESAVQQIPRGPMLREAYWPRQDEKRRCTVPSLETWNNPLDTLANAWCRLLVLVGLRR